jgi:hypothetical protein
MGGLPGALGLAALAAVFAVPLLAVPLIPAFVSDLASLNDHLTGALTLMKGLSR